MQKRNYRNFVTYSCLLLLILQKYYSFFAEHCSFYIIYYYLCIQNLTIQNKKIRIIGNPLSDVRCYIAKLWRKIENR